MRDIQQEHVFLEVMRENEWLSLKIQSIFYHALMVLGMIVNFEVLSKKQLPSYLFKTQKGKQTEKREQKGAGHYFGRYFHLPIHLANE